MIHYSARLLWQYRPRVDGVLKNERTRVCEEQIVVFDAENDEAAFEKAMNYGKDYNMILPFAKGLEAKIEFIGILDIDTCTWDQEDEFKEVWYEMRGIVEPNKRKNKLVPKKNDLSLFGGREAGRGAKQLFSRIERSRLRTRKSDKPQESS